MFSQEEDEEENIESEQRSNNRIKHPALHHSGVPKPSRLPYKSVITKLKEIRSVRNPLKQLSIIFEAKQLIAEEVDSFWQDSDDQKRFCLDAE